jgi:3-phenylpropionate/trans-cinnamate dioxygenase ferredoxin subunit
MFNYKQIDSGEVEFVPIAGIEDLPNGERIFVDIGEHPIVVFNIAGSYFAIGDVCSHDDGPVGEGDLDGLEVICPRHGARFDLRNGKAVGLPAVIDIPAFPVRVNDGQIEIGVPVEE